MLAPFVLLCLAAGAPPGTPPGRVIGRVRERGSGDPLPAVEVTGMSEAYVEGVVRAWVETADFGAVKADLMLAARLLADGESQALPPLPTPRVKAAPAARKRRPSIRDRLNS